MKEKSVEATASKRLTRRDKIEMWMLLDEAVCALRDLQAGKRSPKEESVSETITCIEELQARIQPKIAGAFKFRSKAKMSVDFSQKMTRNCNKQLDLFGPQARGRGLRQRGWRHRPPTCG